MDITLNVISNGSSMPTKKKLSLQEKKAIKIPAKNKLKASSNGEFSFNFGGGSQKVKGIVARRRVPNKTNAKSDDLPKAKAVIKRVASPVNSNSAVEQQQTIPRNESKTMPSSAKQPIFDDLMLNVVTTAPTQINSNNSNSNKSKLARDERLKHKRSERFGRNPFERKATVRSLTEQEIDEGIRKFSKNPNTERRPGFTSNEKPENNTKPDEATGEQNEQQQHAAAANNRTAGSHAKFNAFRDKSVTSQKVGLFDKNAVTQTIGQRFVKPIKERIFEGVKVDSLGLHAHAVKNLLDLLGIKELTTVQQKAIPKALEGKDLLVRSQTGSGKTLAYALPVVEKLQAIRPKVTRSDGILALIIVPTRELAIQTHELFQKLLKPFTWVVPGVLMGGESRKREKARLRKGINVLVGTPGRLVDHLLHTETFKLCKNKFLVLDEADRLLEMGYARDVQQIVEAIDKQRSAYTTETKEPATHLQRLLLSATLTSAVQKLAGLTLHEPLFIDNSNEDQSLAIRGTNGYNKETIETMNEDYYDGDDIEATGVLTIPENLQLNFVVVPPKLRLVTLSALLRKEIKSLQKLKAIVFFSTIEMVNYHYDLFYESLTQKLLDDDDEEKDENSNEKQSSEDDEPLLKGMRLFRLHGSMTQADRQGVFKDFNACKSGVLLATDVVGRGIDVPAIDLVIQYSPPHKATDFVHRVGRTARAGHKGRAILFLAPSEVQFVRKLEDKRIRISQVDMDVYLTALVDADDDARNIQEAASNLQHKFQELVADDKDLHDGACKAFVSWMSFYTAFPKELKPIFNIKKAHMGHFAKSFALKDEPSSFVKRHSAPKPPPPTNRLTHTERDPEKIKLDKRANKQRMFTTTAVSGERRQLHGESRQTHDDSRHTFQPTRNTLLGKMKTSRALNISEFDSGLPPTKKMKH